jgi:hypothetical protein
MCASDSAFLFPFSYELFKASYEPCLHFSADFRRSYATLHSSYETCSRSYAAFHRSYTAFRRPYAAFCRPYAVFRRPYAVFRHSYDLSDEFFTQESGSRNQICACSL